MYGAQTGRVGYDEELWFENDVEMYGAQTLDLIHILDSTFENDVEMYGAQTIRKNSNGDRRLRMM